MATSDLSLLFRLRGDNTQLKSTLTDSQRAVAQLRQSFGPQLTQTITVANQTFAGLDNTLQNFVAQRVPLVGGAIVQITDRLRGFGGESAKAEKAFTTLGRSIESIASRSGKSAPQIASFLTKFVQIEGQAQRNEAAFQFFGGSVDLIGNKTAKFVPELEEASGALKTVSAESAGAGRSIAAMAGPIGITVIALAAMAAGAAVVVKQLFDLTKQTAAFQGKMHDLAQEVNLTVSSLSAFEVLAKRTGGELGTITQAVVLFQRKLDDAQNPLSKTAELFRKFNISTSDTETALRDAFAALAAMPSGFAQTNAAAELFGARGGKQVLAILKETNGDIDGTIRRLREMGILITEDQARAADKFNDDLATLEFQLRALTAAIAEDLIPVFADLIRSTTDVVRSLTPLIKLFIDLSLVGVPLRFALRVASDSLKGWGLVARLVTGDFKGLKQAIKEAREEKFPTIPPVSVPPVEPVPLPGAPSPAQATAEAVNQADVVLEAVKRKVAEQNQALDELFQQGRRNRSQQAEEIIAGNKQVLEAETQSLDARLRQKEQEFKALDEAQVKRGEIIRRDTDDYRAITAEIVKLQQERLNKENEFEVTTRAIRARVAKENADARRNQLDNETQLLVSALDRQIKAIEAQIQRQEISEQDALVSIEALEQAKIEAQLKGVEQRRQVGLLTIQDQVDLNNELKRIEDERAALTDQQNARRLQRDRETAERQRDILISSIDTLLQVQQIRGQRIIDAQAALAEARVITEEQAAKKILEINLALIDAEIEASKAKLKATASIGDVNERVRAEADLNTQIKILTEERASIEALGEREIDEGRRRDLQNFQDYADELEDVTERVTRIQRDTAQEALRLLRINFASRRDIVRARTQLDLDEENERHSQNAKRFRELERENRQSRRSELEKLNIEFEINRAREAEAERHRLAVKGIKDQGKRDDEEASPVGRILGIDTDNLKEFASILESQIVPLGEILKNTFLQVADAIGQTVSNWVLLGETGPAVMRKILATALASIAAEATVNAIKELALGFATLFFNPAESAAHFTAAALWGSIAGGAALAGRGVAGDLFKSKGAAGGAGADGRNSPGQLNPLTLERNQQTQVIRHEHVFRVQSNDSHIVDVFSKDYQSGGKTREIIVKDGEFAV